MQTVPKHIVGGAHAEDVGGYRDVDGKSEVVVGYSHRQGQAFTSLIARQAFTATANGTQRDGGEEVKEGKVRVMQCLTCSEGKEWHMYAVNQAIDIITLSFKTETLIG